MATFIGIVHKDRKSDYGVCFPDFPGCITGGRTLDEAMAMSREAVAAHIELMQDYNDPLPTKPLSLDQAKRHEFAKAASMFIAVEAPLPSQPIRVNVMLDKNLVKRIDEIAPNRSAFLAKAAMDALAARQYRP
jgi:predicted RNase H-like HicB family nuclease